MKALLVVKNECSMCDDVVKDLKEDIESKTLQLVNLENADEEVVDFLCPGGKCPVPFIALVTHRGEMLAKVEIDNAPAGG